MKGRVLTMDLEKIFTGMDQGPETIQKNFDTVNQTVIANQNEIKNSEFKITTYPIVLQNGWTGGGNNAYTLLENDKYIIIAVSFETTKPKGVGFTGNQPIAGDPVVSSHGFGWTKIPGTDWNNGTFIPVTFHDGKVYVEHLGDNVWQNSTSDSAEIVLDVQHVFVWKR